MLRSSAQLQPAARTQRTSERSEHSVALVLLLPGRARTCPLHGTFAWSRCFSSELVGSEWRGWDLPVRKNTPRGGNITAQPAESGTSLMRTGRKGMQCASRRRGQTHTNRAAVVAGPHVAGNPRTSAPWSNLTCAALRSFEMSVQHQTRPASGLMVDG